MNKVVGLGFHGVPSGEALDAIEQEFPRVASTPWWSSPTWPTPRSAPCCGPGLSAGVVRERARPLTARRTEPVTPPGVEVRLSDDPTAWLDVVVSGFAHPDTEGVPSHEEFPREIVENAVSDIEKAGATPYLAFCDGVVAGGGSMRMTDGVAQLTGAATAPSYRRRGVQTALLSVRLADAARAGCDLAVVTTQPGSKSQQNVQRRGFHLLYTRAVLVK